MKPKRKNYLSDLELIFQESLKNKQFITAVKAKELQAKEWEKADQKKEERKRKEEEGKENNLTPEKVKEVLKSAQIEKLFKEEFDDLNTET